VYVCLFISGLAQNENIPVGVFEGVVGVLKVHRGRGHVGDHDCAAVATERVLEESCELGVAIGNMSALPSRITERVDAIAQGEQRLVDVGT